MANQLGGIMTSTDLCTDTLCVTGNPEYKSFDSTGAVSVPIYQSATFAHPELGKSTGFDYSRLKNPTRDYLEKLVASLDRAEYGEGGERDQYNAVCAAVIVDYPAADAESLAVGAVRGPCDNGNSQRRSSYPGGKEQSPVRLISRLVIFYAVHEAYGKYRHLRHLGGI